MLVASSQLGALSACLVCLWINPALGAGVRRKMHLKVKQTSAYYLDLLVTIATDNIQIGV